ERSVFKNYVYNRADFIREKETLQLLCNGFCLNIVDKKTERKKFCVHLEMCRIEYRSIQSQDESLGFIDFRDIKEIRLHANLLTIFVISPSSSVLSILYYFFILNFSLGKSFVSRN